MRRLSCLVLGLCLAAMSVGPVMARDATPGLRVMKVWSSEEYSNLLDPGLRGLYKEAAVDTYCIVWYGFELYDWQGWTRLDETAQPGDFFHVDDFVGLGGGSYGRLVAIEGTKSMWCGVRAATPGDPYLCSWRRAPGYGNGWDQRLTTAAFSFSGAISFSYHIVWDSEPEYDFTFVEYDAGGRNWQSIASYDGQGSKVESHFLPLSLAQTKLRFRFAADGAWSDQDGLWNTDGGCIVDSIRLADSGGLDDFENFESAEIGAHGAGIWMSEPKPGFGMYSGLRNNLTDKDPCGENFGTQVVFFIGSPYPSSSYPGLYDTPFCTGPGGIEAPCQSEFIRSPRLDMTRYSTGCNELQDGEIPPGDLPLLGGCFFTFTIYRDLPLPNLVFYDWNVRNIVSGGCPGQWLDRSFCYYGPEKDFIQQVEDISDLVTGDTLQIMLSAFDMCDIWYLVNGNCAQHTPSPWFDNVRLYRYKTSGPQWHARDVDLFQDNFPGDEFNIESYVRADAANDLNWSGPVIRPGDSITINCTSPLGGDIAADPGGGPAVYLHVKCTYIGPAPAKPNLYGPPLAGNTVHGTAPPVTVNYRYISDDGVWTIIQCDTARTSAGYVTERYCVDLNDQLFTRGYEIEYYFTAVDNMGEESALPRYARLGPPYFEFTCLPTKNSDVLFVDDCTGRGSFEGSVEDYWISAITATLPPPNNKVDRYDVNAPTSGISNGPGSRAKNRQLTDQYYNIVWDSGDLSTITISDGTSKSDRSNDAQMLIDWMDLSEHSCNLWICGDGVAKDLTADASTSALTLMHTKCGVTLIHDSYFDLTGGRPGGGVINPFITGDADVSSEKIFVHGGVPDQFYVFGGCPVINKFDVLDKTANGAWALDYPLYNGTKYYAGISSKWQNGAGADIRTMWFGFSFQYVRDDLGAAPIDRFHIAWDVFQFFQNNVKADITPVEPPRSYKLAQNSPNPFNPSTTIRYDMKEKGLVRIKIYNVAGALVRTLVDGVRDAGAQSVPWDGRNNTGSAVASGIYFYKMEAKGFAETRKMVLLR